DLAVQPHGLLPAPPPRRFRQRALTERPALLPAGGEGAELLGLGALLQVLAGGADPRAQERGAPGVALERPREHLVRAPAGPLLRLLAGLTLHREPRDLRSHGRIINRRCDRMLDVRRVRIALAQVNPTVGAIEANARLILDWMERARTLGAHLVAFPEL